MPMDLSGVGSFVAPVVGRLTVIHGSRQLNPAQIGWQAAAAGINAGYPVSVHALSSAERTSCGVRLMEAGAQLSPHGLGESYVVDVTPRNRTSMMAGLADACADGGMIFVPDILSIGYWDHIRQNIAAMATLARLSNSAVLICVPYADVISDDMIGDGIGFSLDSENDSAAVVTVRWCRQDGHLTRSGNLWFKRAAGTYQCEPDSTSQRWSAIPGHAGRVTKVTFGRA